MLAETIKLDGGVIALIIVLLLIFFVVSVGTVVLGFVMAPRAARGSQTAMVWWTVALVLEGFACLGSIGSLAAGRVSLSTPVMPLIVAAQVAIYVRAKGDAG